MNIEISKRTIYESEAIIKGNESLIGTGLWNIGNELKTIRDEKSYREKGYDSFEEYAEKELKYGRSHCYNFISIAENYNVQSIGQIPRLGMTKLLSLGQLEENERETFIEENPVEDMTTRELRQAIKDKKELEKKIEELENQEPQIIEKEKIVEVVPEDYKYYKDATEKLQGMVSELSRKSTDYEYNLKKLENEKSILERKAKLNEEEAKKFNEMKKQIDFLYKEKADLGRQIASATELSALAVRIDNMLKTELSPIRYSRVFERMDSEVARENLLEIINKVDQWSFDIKQMIPEKYKRVEVIQHE